MPKVNLMIYSLNIVTCLEIAMRVWKEAHITMKDGAKPIFVKPRRFRIHCKMKLKRSWRKMSYS